MDDKLCIILLLLVLRQTIEEVYDEFRKGTILKAVDERGTIIGSVRAYQENGIVYIGKLMVHSKSCNLYICKNVSTVISYLSSQGNRMLKARVRCAIMYTSCKTYYIERAQYV